MIKISKVKEAYSEIESVVGEDFVSDKDFMKAAYSRNVDPAFPDRWADIIVKPETTEEVSEIVKIANKYKLRMVPRGGGADLVGGSVTEEGILIDMTRMNKLEEFNKDDYYIVVGVGITWGDLLSQLVPEGYTTGNTGPGSGFSATIGGGLSNSTAGGGSTKYGLVPDNCLGVEVVLPNPEGTIIKTGSAANKYAKPFCRYGVSPDFTGLFMGDVGTMGIKCKASLRIYREHPYKANRVFLLKEYDYNKVYLLARKIRYEIPDGLLGLSAFPPFYFAQFKIPNVKGPGVSVSLEATEMEILEMYIKKLEDIMKEDTVMMPAAPGANAKPNLKAAFHYFQAGISPVPGRIAMATCHKIPISTLGHVHDENVDWNNRHAKDIPGSVMPGVFEATQYFLPNGNMVVLGGVAGENKDEMRERNMNLWHSKIRTQVRYGGAHYWLGESISQSVVESGAFEPEYEQFFRDMKKTVDPNYLLSPNKFHLHTYDSKFADHYVEPD
ncbi:MAG: FAD-binding oxidoreductase [Candidatus Lokiarchaeota archaeon]|nr:FAD-binding oxidoreductase [Candidatus Lokiarchaeota archaeon]